jgi:arginase
MHDCCIAIIGAPMDLGAGRRGVDMGPSALRLAGLDERIASLGYEFEDLGNIEVEQPESLAVIEENARYLPQIQHTCIRLAHMVNRAVGEGKLPLVLGGDHSVAVGTISGVSNHYRSRGEKIGLIWIDAHADMNTPGSSPSGSGQFAERQCTRYAARVLSRQRPTRIDAHFRLRTESRPSERRGCWPA